MPDEPLRAGSGVRLRFRTDCISGLSSIESLRHGPNYHHLPCIYLQFIVYVCFILSATWPCKGFNFEGGVCVWRKSRLSQKIPIYVYDISYNDNVYIV